MVVNNVSFTGDSGSRLLRVVLVRGFFRLQLRDGLLLFGHGQLEFAHLIVSPRQDLGEPPWLKFAFNCVRNGLLRTFQRPLRVAVPGIGAGSQKAGGSAADIRGRPQCEFVVDPGRSVGTFWSNQ